MILNFKDRIIKFYCKTAIFKGFSDFIDLEVHRRKNREKEREELRWTGTWKILWHNKKSICVARNVTRLMWQEKTLRFNKLVASYRRCVCLIINQRMLFPGRGALVHSFSHLMAYTKVPKLLLARASFMRYTTRKRMHIKEAFRFSFRLNTIKLLDTTYLVQKRTRHINEIMKR